MYIDLKLKSTKSDIHFQYSPHTLRSTLYLYTLKGVTDFLIKKLKEFFYMTYWAWTKHLHIIFPSDNRPLLEFF